MATYYVKPASDGGSDSNTGLSDAQAWATITKVRNAGLATGSNVFFKCGGTWNTKTDTSLWIAWSGADINNYAVVGTYYMDGGNETIGVNVDGKPVLDGGWDTSQPFQMPVMFYGANYVRVQDLKLYNSYGFGIAGTQSAVSSNVSLLRLDIDYTGRGGAVFTSAMGINGRIEYCDIGRHNLRYGADLSTWDAGITYEANNGTIRYNEIHEGKGEGIVINSDNAIVENNLVWATRSVGIYLVGITDGFVRNNVVLGNTDPTYHLVTHIGRSWNGSGLGLNSEILANNTMRNKVYSNVVAGCYRGIQSLNRSGLTIGEANRNFVYNNTFIDNCYNIWTDSDADKEMDTEYKNNISYFTAQGIAQGCKHVFFYTHVGPTLTYRPLGNFWSSTPEFSQWEHANDVIGDPKLFKTSGWQSIAIPSDIDIAASLALTSASEAINTAQNLGATYDDALMVGCDYNTPDASDVDTPIVVVTGDQDDYGAEWDFGAFVYTGGGDAPDPYTRRRGILHQKPQFNQIGGRFR